MYGNQYFYNWTQSLGPYYQIPMWVNTPYQSESTYYSPYIRQVPAINTSKFRSAANRTAAYLTEAINIVNRISNSQQLSYQIMNASEMNKIAEVNKLLLSTGIRIAPSIYYDPEGIRLVFTDKQSNPPCCEVGVVIRWS